MTHHDTLREEYINWLNELCKTGGTTMEAQADWWLSKLEADRALLREKVEGMKKEEWDEIPCKECGKSCGSSRNQLNTAHNEVLNEVLALLTPKN